MELVTPVSVCTSDGLCSLVVINSVGPVNQRNLTLLECPVYVYLVNVILVWLLITG